MIYLSISFRILLFSSYLRGEGNFLVDRWEVSELKLIAKYMTVNVGTNQRVLNDYGENEE